MGTRKVLETTDYGMFRRLDGNRAVSELRVKKIIGSIKKVGYVTSPIVVNDQNQVIDGQGRLEALKRLKLPVHYIVVPNIGINECIAMNMNQSNWTLMDYITSHAETGNVSYMYLLNLIKAYGKTLQNKVILYVVTGKIESAAPYIKDGNLVCTADDYNRAQKVLSYLTGFAPVFRRVQGHNEYYYEALAFCHEDPEIDNDRLAEKMVQLQGNLYPVTTILQAFDVIEEIYNNRARKRVYIKTNYRKAMDDKYSWYNAKYGDKYEEEN